tara:strand:- start:1790 stop:2161 length:372 start_codon:yes stop_codon:yes gene_type:complete
MKDAMSFIPAGIPASIPAGFPATLSNLRPVRPHSAVIVCRSRNAGAPAPISNRRAYGPIPPESSGQAPAFFSELDGRPNNTRHACARGVNSPAPCMFCVRGNYQCDIYSTKFTPLKDVAAKGQ